MMELPERPAFPRRGYRIALWLIALFTVAPFLSVLATSVLADMGGCRVDEGSVHPCMLFGMDLGGLLYTMGVMGWLMLATLPIGVVLLAAWFIVREVHMRIWTGRHGPA